MMCGSGITELTYRIGHESVDQDGSRQVGDLCQCLEFRSVVSHCWFGEQKQHHLCKQKPGPVITEIFLWTTGATRNNSGNESHLNQN